MVTMVTILKNENGEDQAYFSIKEVIELTGLSRGGVDVRIGLINERLAPGEEPIIKRKRGMYSYLTGEDIARMNNFQSTSKPAAKKDKKEKK